MTWLLLLLTLLFEVAPDGDDESTNEEETDGEVRDPEKKLAAMQDHIDRLHRRIEERDGRIKELEQGAETPSEALRSARLEAAFLREVLAAGQTLDAETAWDLLKIRGFIDLVKINDEGAVSGMDQALAGVLDRYPWLTDVDAIPEPTSLPASGGRAKKKKATAPNDAGLSARFPALRK